MTRYGDAAATRSFAGPDTDTAYQPQKPGTREYRAELEAWARANPRAQHRTGALRVSRKPEQARPARGALEAFRAAVAEYDREYRFATAVRAGRARLPGGMDAKAWLADTLQRRREYLLAVAKRLGLDPEAAGRELDAADREGRFPGLGDLTKIAQSHPGPADGRWREQAVDLHDMAPGPKKTTTILTPSVTGRAPR